VLLRRGAVSSAQLEAALMEDSPLSIEERLVSSGVVSPEELILATAEQASCPALPLGRLTVPNELWALATPDVWIRMRIVPVCRIGDRLVVATADVLGYDVQEQIAHATGLKPFIVAATHADVASQTLKSSEPSRAGAGLAMESVMAAGDAGLEVATTAPVEESLETSLEKAEEAPVIRMVHMMLIEALRTNASDIHVEAMEKTSRLRYRIDGVLTERPAPPKALHNAIVSRIKILSDLGIAERRMPQDGRFKVKALGKEVDIRVSILPTIHGEKVVMRTLDKTNLAPSLTALGLDEFAYRAMKYAIEQPHGILLVTGPTGSGKTTTLYSCLQELNQTDVNIVTVEDPVEYQLAGVNQVHVNTQVGLTFASVLRSVLRQDPDIVLVGEIRDGETADVAVKAALTGHLVLSTLHTNDAPGVIVRLVDMGVPPFMIASALILAQAQRLYRRLCSVCKVAELPDPQVLKANRIDPAFFGDAPIFHQVGCPKCNNIGFRGRSALMEVLPMTEALRDGIMRGATTGALREIAIREGMLTLKEAGMRKVRDGITSISAVLEVTGGE
jgi:type IV pilus assembly protein PilB